MAILVSFCIHTIGHHKTSGLLAASVLDHVFPYSEPFLHKVLHHLHLNVGYVDDPLRV